MAVYHTHVAASVSRYHDALAYVFLFSFVVSTLLSSEKDPQKIRLYIYLGLDFFGYRILG